MDYNKLGLFITSELAFKFEQQEPFKNCTCRKGIIKNEKNTSVPFEYCDKCTKPFLLENILDVPDRYNKTFKSETFFANEKELLKKQFLLLTGHDYYVKLVGYYLAKKIMLEQKLVTVMVTTKTYKGYQNENEEDSSYNDFIGLKFAEVVLFNDLAGLQSDNNYTLELTGRMDRNQKIIFLNVPKIINLKDSNDLLLPDVFEFEVES